MAALVFAIAMVVRMIHINSYMAFPGFDFPIGGNALYILIAIKIANGDLLGGSSLFFDNSPLYYYILAGMMKLFGGLDFYSIRMLQAVIGSVSCSLIAVVAKRHFGLAAALISGLIACFYGPFIFYDAEIVAVPWIVFFSLITLSILTAHPKRMIAYFLAGLSFGAAITLRLNLVLYLFFLSVYYLIFPDGHDRMSLRIKILAAILSGAVLFPGLIMVRNYAVTDEFMLLGPSGGHNFYFGHHENAKAYFSESLDFRGAIALKYKELAESELKRELTYNEASRYWFRKGLSYIAEHPGADARLSLEKTLAFFKDQEIPTYFNYDFSRKWSIILNHGSITFGVVFPFFCIGLIPAIRCRAPHFLLLSFLLTSLISVLLTFMIARLRMPAIPVMILYAGCGVAYLFRIASRFELRKLVAAVFAVVFLFWFSVIPVAHFNTGHNYNLLGVVLWKKGRLTEAQDAFEKAIQVDPYLEYPYLNLIKINRSLGNEKKVTSLSKALQRIRDSKGDEKVDKSNLTRYLRPYMTE